MYTPYMSKGPVDSGRRNEPGLDRSWGEHAELTRESAALVFDWLKHVATLSAGSLLAIPVLVRTVFPSSLWTWLVPVTLVFLLLAVVASVTSAVYVIILRGPPDVLETEESRRIRLVTRWAAYRLFVTALVLLVFGFGSFTVFVMANMF